MLSVSFIFVIAILNSEETEQVMHIPKSGSAISA